MHEMGILIFVSKCMEKYQKLYKRTVIGNNMIWYYDNMICMSEWLNSFKSWGADVIYIEINSYVSVYHASTLKM